MVIVGSEAIVVKEDTIRVVSIVMLAYLMGTYTFRGGL